MRMKADRVLRVARRMPLRLWHTPVLALAARNVGPFIPVVLLWQLAVMLQIWPRSFVPPPAQIPRECIYLIKSASLLPQVGMTIIRVFAGGLIGLVAGISIGTLIGIKGINRFVYNALRDIIDYFQAIGEVGWLPVFIIWSGFNDRTIILTVAYTVFFPVFFGTVSGFRRVPQNLINSVRTLGARPWHVVRDVLLPGSLPAIITGFRAGMGFGWRTVIIAEMLVAQSGLGVVVFNARTFLRVDWIIVGMIIAGLLWLSIDNLLLESLEARTIVKWGAMTRARQEMT